MTRIHQLFLSTLFAVWISYAKSDAEFTYFGNMGPDHWSEHFNQCAGKHQSPININEVDVINREYSDMIYKGFDITPKTATMLNNGHTVLVKMTYDNQIPTIESGPLAGKGTFQFQQLHFHWGENNTVGSEDRINNVSYPMELHAVFRNQKYDSFEKAVRKDDGVAVLAAFYEVAAHHKIGEYDTLTNHLTEIHKPGTNTTLNETTSLGDFLSMSMVSYYTYTGSLTTPPCSEDVVWIDYAKPIKISSELIERFRYLNTYEGKSLTHNFRPVQPLNNRKVYKVTEEQRLPIKDEGDIVLVNAWGDQSGSASISTSSISVINFISIFATVYLLNIHLGHI